MIKTIRRPGKSKQPSRILLINQLIQSLRYLLPPAVWAAFIYFLSNQASLPGFELSAADFVLKKSGHMFVYGILWLLLHHAITKIRTNRTTPKTPSVPAWSLAFMLTIAYAFTDELHQTMVPGRYGSVKDIGYDALGALIALLKKYRYI